MGVVVLPQIVKSEDEWRKQLSPAAFDVKLRARVFDDSEVGNTEVIYNNVELWH